ncbi:hypothetical protein A2714_01855 [Candidatus Woesebacteria bacterium RIFCSPHIGHO2_01_FULL_38_9]|uniref:Type II secretion system protein GspG C-terminal domain-containing protein n=2 Tax=Candidatus Woeseibacteriota TaxID=1752722 RepID=A0A1F7Y1B7_9BACT|nr:MAG: hypothetical protein A2714_01855 [Candidatus Woesebacteria bacterium RIFCSPHIGHO2_01_FULL_38_9]OGM58574.1 MAG: hypothetical protein A3A75_02540 [Candidatus Woesebacteria bacterium RIFCSPLOWO2_01_FULL_39_10]
MKKGFSLIELLVVMAIISVLAGVSLLALRGARESGRDARRKADLAHIASGIEIYKADCRYYPNATALTAGSPLIGSGVGSCSSSNYYIQSVPDDPDSTNFNYIYVPLPSGCSSTSNCTRFQLWTLLEDVPTSNLCTGTYDCGQAAGTQACNFCIINP